MNATVVVIGAGPDELVAAHALARSGRRVVVLEEHPACDDAFAGIGWVPPEIVRGLGLVRRGLAFWRPDPWVATPLPGGGRLELWHDMARSVEAIRRVSVHDADRWPAFCERMARLARLLEALYTAPPPDPLRGGLRNLARLARLGVRMRGLGRQGIEDLLRFLPMSVADLLDEWFENDVLKAVLGATGVMHLHQGPRSGGTAFNLLHRHVGSPPGVFRPAASNIGRVLAERPGVEIRRGTKVARISVREGRVTGVELASGEQIAAGLIVSGADPRRTLLALVDPGWFDPEVVRAAQKIRSRGIVARVSLAFDRPPGFSRLVVAPSLDYIERAYDDAKYGRISAAPYLEALSVVPAADGRHRVDVHVQYAPHTIADGEWDDEHRSALGKLAVKVLSHHLPVFDAAVVMHALSPRDLEVEYGWPEGQACHAELALDQVFWMRPIPGWAHYRTPIAGLYLCGPGTHPGGGIVGAAGANAAGVILRDQAGK